MDIGPISLFPHFPFLPVVFSDAISGIDSAQSQVAFPSGIDSAHTELLSQEPSPDARVPATWPQESPGHSRPRTPQATPAAATTSWGPHSGGRGGDTREWPIEASETTACLTAPAPEGFPRGFSVISNEPETARGSHWAESQTLRGGHSFQPFHHWKPSQLPFLPPPPFPPSSLPSPQTTALQMHHQC